MKLKFSHILSLVLLVGSLVPAFFFLIHRFEKKDNLVIFKSQELQPYYGKKDVVMIASTGRSGSTMLTHVIRDQAPKYHVLKTHILPPR